MYDNGYPTANFQRVDNSGASSDVLFSQPSDGLCVPFAFIMAERGEPGRIYGGGAAELTPALGSETFSQSSPYYNSSTQFLGYAMAGQYVEVMRLIDPDAATASFGLFLSVTPTDLVQYQKDVTGVRLVDIHGDWLPKLMVDGVTPITAPGVVLKWSTRVLTSNEVTSGVQIATVQNQDQTTTTIYPIQTGTMTSPGSYGNRQGYKLFSTGTLTAGIATSIDSVLYRFVPMALPTGTSTTASAIADEFGALYNDVSFKDVAIYGPTTTNYAFKSVLGTAYADASTGESTLPYGMVLYGANVQTVGNQIIALSEDLTGTDPYLIDLIAGAGVDGLLYDVVEIDSASSTVVNTAVVNYGLGGSDGDTSFAKLDQLVADWCAGSNYGEFPNLQQHPMTHFSDPGYSMPTKILLLNMLSQRDNFKIDLSTQDVSQVANTQAQDMSAGQTLLFQAQMHPDSTITGVGCSRVGIYAHASTLITGSVYSGLVPFNLHRLIQRRNLDGGQYVKGSSGGLPNSAVTIFRKPNWVADSTSARSLAWASAINVVMHANMTTIFYPSIRTVYPDDTSLFSDDEISDTVAYLYKICRYVWAKYAGVNKPPKKQWPIIEKDMRDLCSNAFSLRNFTVNPTLFQTAQDANLGYATSVNVQVLSNLPNRVMNFDVELDRAP